MDVETTLKMVEDNDVRFKEETSEVIGVSQALRGKIIPDGGYQVDAVPINGLMVFADSVIKVVGTSKGVASTLGIGKNVILSDLDSEEITITKIGETLYNDEVASSSTADDQTTLVLGKNYLYSILVGSKVYGGISDMEDEVLRLYYNGEAIADLTIGSYTTESEGSPLPLATVAANLVVAFNAEVLAQLAYQAVSLQWNTDESRFELVSNYPGEFSLNIIGDARVYIGMADALLYYGQEDDRAGEKVILLDGTNVGSSYTIDSLEFSELVIDEVISDFDTQFIRIYVDAPDKCTADIVVYGPDVVADDGIDPDTITRV